MTSTRGSLIVLLLCWTAFIATSQLLQRKVCPFVSKYKPARKCSNPNHLCKEDLSCPPGQRCCQQEDECSYKCRATVPPRGCPIPIDLAFVLDSSGSIGRRNWLKVKNFVKGIIDYYDISDKGTHVGIVMYSSGASVQLYFNHFKGPDLNNINIKRAVDDLILEKGLTFIDKGLNVSYHHLFTVDNGMRPGRKKVCLVITDGIQTKTRGPYTPLNIASAPLKEQGITLYALGIGKNVRLDELLAVGSGPEYVYSAKSFDELQAEVEEISKAQCQACGSRVDVIFGIPDASNLGEEFNAIKEFFVKLTSLFQVNAKTSHIGVIRYSNDADMMVKLDQMYRIHDLSKTIKAMKPQGNKLDVERALDVAANIGFTIFGGSRQTAPKTFITFIPQNNIQKPSIAIAANKLKGMGVRIIMVGITRKIDPALSTLASQPPLRYFVSGVDFGALGVAAYEVADTACKARYGKCQAFSSSQLARCTSDVASKECDVDKDCNNNDFVCCKGDCGKVCQDRVKNCLVTMDVAIAIDISSRIPTEEFLQVKSFTAHLIHSFSQSENAVRFGLMQYDTTAKTLAKFLPFTNEAKLKTIINQLKTSANANTRVDLALEAMKEELFSIKGGMRQGHPRYAVILTSGEPKASGDLRKAAEGLRKAAVNIVAVGTRIAVAKTYLNSLAARPSMTFRPILSNELTSLWPRVAQLMCSAKPGSCPVPAQEACSGKPKISTHDIPCGQTAGYGERADKINDWDCPGEQKCCLDPSGCLQLCQQPPNTCDGQYDLALLLESTDDIGFNGFEKVKQFAIKLVDAFTIWHAASRIAVITFGSRHQLNFQFNSFSGSSLNKQAVTSAIRTLPLIGGTEPSSDALQTALDEVFTISGGSRENANKSLVVISQGKFKDSSKAIKIASDLRKVFVDVFAVPIGTSADLGTLTKLVSKPIEKTIFMTTSFNALISNVRAMTQRICEGAEKVKICKTQLDVVFAIPSSVGSSRKGIEDVFKSIMGLLKVSNLDVHVGLETYSDTADVNVNIDSSYNRDNITEYINRLKGIGEKADVEQALKTAFSSGFTIFSGIRQTSPKAFILMVPEGASLSGTSIRDASQNLKGLGVRLFVIGLASALDKSLVRPLVSQPAQKFIYTAENYNELAALASEIVDSLCRGRYGKCPIASPISTCPKKTTSQCLLDKDCSGEEHKCCEDQCGSSACTKGVQNCFIAMDVAIAVDSSSSSSDADFNQVKSFASHLIHSLVNAENAIKFGLIQYSQQAKTLVNFRRVTTETILKSIVKKMEKFPGSISRVDNALLVMRDDLFSLSGGMRQGHPRYAVFITSGTTLGDSGDIKEASEDLKKLGVKIIAIGVTRNIGFLNKLASDEKFSFPLQSSIELQTLWPRLASQMCSAKPGICPVVVQKDCLVKPKIGPKQLTCGSTAGNTHRTPKENDWDCPGEEKCCLDTTGCLYLCQEPPNECNGQFDLTFILEASLYVGTYGLDKVKELANRLVDAFTISSAATRIAVITHARPQAVVNLKFNTVTGKTLTKEMVRNLIRDVGFVGASGSALSEALQMALNEVYTTGNGMRESSNKVKLQYVSFI